MADNGEAGHAIVQRVVISNQRGLHARAAARFVKLAGGYDAAVTVTAKGTTVPGLSIMGLMMLAAGPGTELEITAHGADAAAAVASLVKLVADRFGESE
jgi:phosphocarrier protein